MSIIDKLNQDIKNISVEKEVMIFEKSLNSYIKNLNQKANDIGGVGFDYVGGVLKSYNYFKFRSDVTILQEGMDNHTATSTLRILTNSINMSFKVTKKTCNLFYWSHVVKSNLAKEDILELIDIVDELNCELLE